MKLENLGIFLKEEEYFLDEFNKVLRLLIFCSQKMILDKKIDLIASKEDDLRNLLVTYLRDNKKRFNVCLYFNCGGESIDEEDNYKTWGRFDINIQIPNKLCDENKSFVFECKRLNGEKEKNDLYIKEGIYRFILGKYAEKMPLGGMIGFVQGLKKNSDMSGLVSDIKNTLTENQQIKTIRNLAFYEIDENFKYSYSSQHKRTGKLPKIDLYHLFFDFSKN